MGARRAAAPVAVQGNLDPLLLLVGGRRCRRRVAARSVGVLGGGPSSSISATACAGDAARACRRSWSSWCAAADALTMPRAPSCCSISAGRIRSEAVEPFLFNLFSDPAIIRLPHAAALACWRGSSRGGGRRSRARSTRKLGGGSPLLANTEAQARRWKRALGARLPRVFVAMRYWHPSDRRGGRARCKAWRPDEIVLLPLYPQYSTTTTASSLARLAARGGAAAGSPRRRARICCYPDRAGLHRRAGGAASRQRCAVAAQRQAGACCSRPMACRERSSRAAIPIAWQVERRRRRAARRSARPALDWRVCYQSRVGPLEMARPSTDEEIRRAGAERVRAGRRADRLRLRAFRDAGRARHRISPSGRGQRRAGAMCRVPTVGTDRAFIAGLAGLVRGAARRPAARPAGGRRLCPPAAPCPCDGVARELAALYPWLKALHIISVIAWMAGLLYLPRLYRLSRRRAAPARTCRRPSR